MSKKTGWQKRRRISIVWGYYVLVDDYNYTLYKNGDTNAVGYYNSLENAIGGVIRENEKELDDCDLVSYVTQLKKFKTKMIKDITNAVIEKQKKDGKS